MSRIDSGRHGSHRPSTLSRRFSLNASVRRAALAEDHEVALEEFKGRVAHAGLQLPAALLINGDVDATLLRFLRARKYNVDNAMAMLEKSLAWRVRVGADTALEHPLDPALMSLVRQCRPSSYIGFDAQHHPIFVERLGKLDGPRIEKEGVADENILAYHLREMEYMAQVVFSEASAAAGHTVDRVISVMDANGLTLSSLTGFAQRLFRLITSMDSDNYPECCHAIYIVNGGMAFGAIWRIVSPFVDKGTRDKVHVLGSGKSMQAQMLAALGRANTPRFLGGDLDFDAVCRHWWGKMDAAMVERRDNPKAQQPPVVLQPAASLTNGNVEAHHQHQQQQRGSFNGSVSGLRLPKMLHRRSSESDTYNTPMSATSRFSAASMASVYFDAQETADPPSGAASTSSSTQASPPPSLTGVTGPDGHTLTHGTGTAATVAAGGSSSPFAAASTPGGSMSVGPQSCSRSQLSGFTLNPQHGPGAGTGRQAELHEVDTQLGAEAELQRVDSRNAPLCGCRCVIS